MENSNTLLTLTTTGGHVITYRSFITGRDAEALSEVTGETPEKKTLAATHKTIEMVVQTLDGKKNGDQEPGGQPFNVLEAIRDLPFAEYVEIAEAVSDAAVGKKKAQDTVS
jgi:hypothetical protein